MCEAALSFLGPLPPFSLHMPRQQPSSRAHYRNYQHASHANIRALPSPFQSPFPPTLPHAFHIPGFPRCYEWIKFANDNE